MAIAVTAAGFVPEYLRFLAGAFPITTVLHFHAGLMGAWLATFVLQAGLAARGRVALHRRIGRYGIALGVVAWISMIVVTLYSVVADPLPGDPAGYDALLQDVYTAGAFIVLLLWATRERRRPDWHRRLMVIALFVTLLAPIERIEWLPELGIGFIWASILWLDIALVSCLLVHDMIPAMRLHPATLQGLAMLFAAQLLTWFAWGTTPWRSFAFSTTRALRAAFQP